MKNVIVTCPPMLGQFDRFIKPARDLGLRLHKANVTQILSEDELCQLIPKYDGWIIGDDPATRRVFEAARKGKLTAAVKWGIGVDNVDFEACRDMGIPITNTPMMFGEEVADVATAYVIGLARELFLIDQGVRSGNWPKPAGISLRGRNVGIVGLGDIGKATCKRMQALGLNVIAYDPGVDGNAGIAGLERAFWPERISDLDFLIFTCSLTKKNHHMLNFDVLAQAKKGIRVINVARGPLIEEAALVSALKNGIVHSAALDVFEIEPLALDNPLRQYNRCIFGSHNGSNTVDSVIRASESAMKKLREFLYA